MKPFPYAAVVIVCGTFICCAKPSLRTDAQDGKPASQDESADSPRWVTFQDEDTLYLVERDDSADGKSLALGKSGASTPKVPAQEASAKRPKPLTAGSHSANPFDNLGVDLQNMLAEYLTPGTLRSISKTAMNEHAVPAADLNFKEGSQQEVIDTLKHSSLIAKKILIKGKPTEDAIHELVAYLGRNYAGKEVQVFFEVFLSKHNLTVLQQDLKALELKRPTLQLALGAFTVDDLLANVGEIPSLDWLTIGKTAGDFAKVKTILATYPNLRSLALLRESQDISDQDRSDLMAVLRERKSSTPLSVYVRDLALSLAVAEQLKSVAGLVSYICGTLERTLELAERGLVDKILTERADKNQFYANQFDAYWGSTPLMFATQRQDVELMEILVKHKADPKLRNPLYNSTALDYLKWPVPDGNKALRMAKALKSPGLFIRYVHLVENRTMTPIELDEIESLLNQPGVDVNERWRYAGPSGFAKDGSTPLMIAAFRGDLPLINLLLSKGADARAKNSAGKSVATYASTQPKPLVFDIASALNSVALFVTMHDGPLSPEGYQKIRDMLQNKGEIDERNNMGETALMVAAKRADLDLLSFLIKLKRPSKDGDDASDLESTN